MADTKPQAKLRVVNKGNCSYFDGDFYLDVVKNEAGYSDTTYADGFHTTNGWTTDGITMTSDLGTAKFKLTAASACKASYAFNEELVQNKGFENRLQEWNYKKGNFQIFAEPDDNTAARTRVVSHTK